MTIPTWQECLDAGMTKAEAGAARGTKSSAAYQWAKENGKVFAKGKPGSTNAYTTIDFAKPFYIVMSHTARRATYIPVTDETVADALNAATDTAMALSKSTGRPHVVVGPNRFIAALAPPVAAKTQMTTLAFDQTNTETINQRTDDDHNY